ncbi:uncharacterized protein LOC144437769 [Glandiceps talaboti]
MAMIEVLIQGIEGTTTVIEINQHAQVNTLLAKLSERNKIPVPEQRVIYAGKQLEPGRGKVLSDYYIKDKSLLFVVLRLRGGSSLVDTQHSELRLAVALRKGT